MTDNAQYYDKFSERYDAPRGTGYHLMVDTLSYEGIRQYVRGDVLEIGCGTGLMMQRLARTARHVRGIDISSGMLKRAKERGLDVLEGDATELPYESASFDFVCSFKVLSHVRNIEKAVAEAVRVTKPGGYLGLEFYNRNSLRYMVKRLAGPRATGVDQKEDAISTRWYSIGEACALFPTNVTIKGVHGVRCVTPAAALFEYPGVGRALDFAESVASRSPLRRAGGFLTVIAQKST